MMMNWNCFPISLILFVGVFYLSTSADDNQNNLKGKLKTLIKKAKDIQRIYKKEFLLPNVSISCIDKYCPLVKPANCSHVCPYPNSTRVEDLDFLSRAKAIFDHMISEEDKIKIKKPVSAKVSKPSTSYRMNECLKAAEAALPRLGPRPSCDCGLPRQHNWTTALEPKGTSSLLDYKFDERQYKEYINIILHDIIEGVKGILSHHGKAKAPGKGGDKQPGRGKGTKTTRKQKKKEGKQDKKGRKTPK